MDNTETGEPENLLLGKSHSNIAVLRIFFLS